MTCVKDPRVPDWNFLQLVSDEENLPKCQTVSYQNADAAPGILSSAGMLDSSTA